MDLDTIQFYDNHAEEYIDQTIGISMNHVYDHFLPLLPTGGHILDVGCGSCRDSAVFQSRGFTITAFDASQSLVKIAQQKFTFPVHCARFDTFTSSERYDGIWASASLLHLQRKDLHKVLSQLRALLKEDGVFYCSFKMYDSAHVDTQGRFFTAMTPDELQKILLDHFRKVTTFTSQGNANEVWCNAVAI